MNIEITETEDKNIITDSLGRKIRLKEITGKTRISFYRALGPKDSANMGIVTEYWNVMAVDEIEGRKQASIKVIADIDFIYGELDKSNASQLIDEWLLARAEEKQISEKERTDHIKK